MRREIYRCLAELGYGRGSGSGDGIIGGTGTGTQAGAGAAADGELLSLWRSWYEGNVARFHSYRVYNGQKRVLCRRASLGMAKKICEDWANLLMNERVRISAEGDREQKFLDRVLTENRFPLLANRMQELKAALGTAACVPRVCGGRIVLDGIDAEGIFPLSWENGEITDCAFAVTRREEGRNWVYVQVHHRVRGLYRIENLLFASDGGRLEPCPLDALPSLRGLPETLPTGREERQFVTDRMNTVNNLAPDSPMGLSVFANAIDQLRGADVAYDSYVNEFILGKKRIMLKPEATKDFDGAPLFDTDELAFYILPEDSGNGSVIREIDMSLRTAEHHQGIQDMLNLLSVKCGLGEQYYRFERGTVRTATEVISSNSSLYRSVCRHELLLEASLKELMQILLRMGCDWLGESVNPETPIRIDFDDSILEDRSSEFDRDCRMLELGVMEKEEFRKKWIVL